MPSYRYHGKNGKRRSLIVSSNYVVVRTHERTAMESRGLKADTLKALQDLEPMLHYEAAGVQVLRVRARRGMKAARDRIRGALKGDPSIEFAGRVLCHARSRMPVVYTENIFVKFLDRCGARHCRKVLRGHGLELKREIEYLKNGFFLGAPEGCGMAVFDAAEKLLAEDSVELCHPELITQAARREIFPQQWHLKKSTVGGRVIDAHANVEPAWRITRGEGIVIAVIDDGFDIDHEEFASADKITGPLDVTADTENPRPGARDDHGTACAGVACADGLHHAAGVAPGARLMPIRLKSGLGSQDEADAIQLAAEKGADVISCSWGPEDGNWQNKNDPRHKQVHPLPDSTRLAIDWAVEHGRSGKGCVVTWAAGNGDESVDNDGYASYQRVMAVAACSDRGTRSVYSDHGKAIWCCFPSDDFAPTTRTPGIWTTDRSGSAGYNPGRSRLGDRRGKYVNSFGGTSSACPGVAGVAALMLAANPDLNWQDVREAIRETCDRIDPEHGAYDDGGHSTAYGYGRVNAERAVRRVARVSAAEATDRRSPRRLVAGDRAELEIKMLTTAPAYALWIDQRPLHFVDGVAKTMLMLGERYVLSWWVEGKPSTLYRIRFNAGPFRVLGRLPVRRRIAKGRNKSAGTRMFSVEK